MPRRRVLTEAQLENLLALPTTEAELVRYWTLDDEDLAIIGRRRRAHNRLGFALQLCALRYPGRVLCAGEVLSDAALSFVAEQIGTEPDVLADYGARVQTRYQQLDALRAQFGFGDLAPVRQEILGWLLPVALATTSATSIAEALCEELRRRPLIVPAPSVVEDLVAAALMTAEPHVARQLADRLSPAQVAALDGLLSAEAGTSTRVLAWRVSPHRKGERLAHAEAARDLPAPERSGPGVARDRPHRADAVHAGLAGQAGPASAGNGRAQQRRSPQRARSRRLLSSARPAPGPDRRAAAASGERPRARYRRDRPLEHRLSRAGSRRLASPWRGRFGRSASPHRPARLATRQPDRRLPLGR